MDWKDTGIQTRLTSFGRDCGGWFRESTTGKSLPAGLVGSPHSPFFPILFIWLLLFSYLPWSFGTVPSTIGRLGFSSDAWRLWPSQIPISRTGCSGRSAYTKLRNIGLREDQNDKKLSC